MWFKLLQIAAIYAPPQFDTSSGILIDPSSRLEWLARKFLTWDSVYYASVAQRGVQYEHEFAFSPIWASVLGTCPTSNLCWLVLYGVAISLVCSWVTGYLIQETAYVGGLNAIQAKKANHLYAFSPAAAFLIAGYPESMFAALSMVGLWLFYKRYFISSGLIFGLTCLFRSNGLLWGILFAYTIWTAKYKARIFLGGALLGAGFLVPQIRLYNAMCFGAKAPEWCSRQLPLGYSSIQAKYWGNGLFQYWTPNNIPNFLFALPTLVLLYKSLPVLPRELQLVQIAYLLGALLFWHVQIVTRVASCLPGMYWYIAKYDLKGWKRFFILWGLVQAVLFGAFMPPA